MYTVLGAIAVLRARVVPMVCVEAARLASTFQGPKGKLHSPSLHDTLDGAFKVGQQLYCVPFIKYEQGLSCGQHTICLILDRETDSPGWPNAYRRLGRLWVDERSDGASLGAEFQEIELI